jgi:ligand-binding sensor domain-containing protein
MKKIIRPFLIAAYLLANYYVVKADYPDWQVFTNHEVINTVYHQGNTIWVGTTGGLIRYNTETGVKTIFNKGNSSLPSNAVETVQADNEGNIWIGTYDAGIAVYDGKNWKAYSTTNSVLPGNAVRSIFIDKNDNKWIGTDLGLVKVTGTNWKVMDGFMGDVWSMDMDKDGALWIGCGGGTWMLKNSTFTNLSDSVPLYGTTDVECDTVTGLTIMAGTGGVITWNGQRFGRIRLDSQQVTEIEKVAFDQNHNLWMASGGEGVLEFDGKNFTTYQNIPLVGRSISFENGQIWLGTDQGLYSFANGSWTKSDITSSPIKYDPVSRVIAGNDGKIWFVNGDYVGNYDGQNWKYYQLPFTPGMYRNINNLRIDQYGTPWIATSEGLYKIQGDKLVLVPIANEPATIETRDIAFDDVFMYVSTDSNLYVYAEDWKKITPQSLNYRATIVRLIVDKNETVWAGTNSDQVMSFNGTEWKSYSYAAGTFPGGYINNLYADDKGNVYACTWGSGICKFDGSRWSSNASISRFTSAIAFDNKSQLWGVDLLTPMLFNDNNAADTFGLSNSPLVKTSMYDLAIDKNNNFWIASGNGLLEYTGAQATGINEKTLRNFNVSVFPNPANDHFRINVQGAEPQQAIVRIYSLNGELISATSANTNNGEISVNQLKPGAYIVKVTGKDFNYQTKVTVLTSL